MSLTNSRPVHHLAQLSYCLQLLNKKNVLLMGDDYSMALYLADSDVACIIAVSPNEPASEWCPVDGGPEMEHIVMPLDELDFDDRVFDAIVIPDLSDLANPIAVLKEAKRVLDPAGAVIVASPNPESLGTGKNSLDYYALYEVMAGVFPSVQMVGQSPFGGYSVVDLACEDEDIEINFDSDLMGGRSEEIAWFIAVCGATPVTLDPYLVVQVPVAESGGTTASASADELASLEATVAELRQQVDQSKRELGNRGVRIESLEKKLEEELMQSEEARARAVKLAKELDDERKAATKKQLENEFSRRSVDIDLQAELREAKKQLRLADERAHSAEVGRDELIDQMRRDTAELDRLRQRLQEAEDNKRHQERNQEIAKNLRLAEERARSAEAARDEIIEKMRSDAAELDRLRERLWEISEKQRRQEQDVDAVKNLRLAEERARSAEAARNEIIEKTRTDAAELDRLRAKLDENDGRVRDLQKREAALKEELAAVQQRAEASEKTAASSSGDIEEVLQRMHLQFDGMLPGQVEFVFAQINTATTRELGEKRAELRLN